MSEGGNAELLALQRIDEAATQLQQQGNYLGALECLERGLVLRQHFFGAESDEVWGACKSVAEMCNLLAMTYLQQQDFAVVLELLKKAEILTERDEAGRAVTLNNLACYYRRQGKLHAALTHLQKALKIEAKLQRVDNAADTHLNMCAVLSQLGNHPAALEHAQSALILLQEELFAQQVVPLSEKADRVAVLAIAYHNIGVEQEFMKKLPDAMNSYRKGVAIAEQHLGEKHGIAITLRNSCIAVRRAQAMHRKGPGGAAAAAGVSSKKRGGGGQQGAPGARGAGKQQPARRAPRAKAPPAAGSTSMASTSFSASATSTGAASSAAASAQSLSAVPTMTLGQDPTTLSLADQRAALDLERQQPRALRRGAGAAAAGEEPSSLPEYKVAQMISPRPAAVGLGGGAAAAAGSAPARAAEEEEEEEVSKEPEPEDAAEAVVATVELPRFPAGSTCLLRGCLTQELADSLAGVRTAAGCDLAAVIRSAASHPQEGIGAFAGDEQCFGAFGAVLRPLIAAAHADFPGAGSKHATNLDASRLQMPLRSALDPAVVLGVAFRATRSVKGFSFAPAITAEARLQLEQRVQAAFGTLGADLAGSYCPVDALYQIDPAAATALKGDKLWAAAGGDREWPAGRGLFTSADKALKIEVNCAEHVVVRVEQEGGAIQPAFEKMCLALAALEQSFEFAYDDELGFLAGSLQNLGTGLRCVVRMKLPLTSKEPSFGELLANYELDCAVEDADSGVLAISNKGVFGCSEDKLVQKVFDGVAFLSNMEATLSED